MKKRIPRAIQFVKDRKRLFKAAGKVLDLAESASKGGPLGKALGSFVAVGQLVEVFYPDDTPWSYFSNRGYVGMDSPINGFLCELLMASQMEKELVAISLTECAYLFTDGEIKIGAVFSGNKYSSGPYLLSGNEESLIVALRKIVWKDGFDVMLSAENNGYSHRGSNRFRISQMQEPGPFLGIRYNPKSFAERLALYRGTARSVLLRGPTGVGKSVFARHVARHSSGQSTKTLKIASSVLEKCGFVQIAAMIKLFEPMVLLLDDLSLDNPEKTESFLALLEALRDPNCLVIATVMTKGEDDPDKEAELGDWHFPGIRPGRIDEILGFFLPTKEERNLILRHYLRKELDDDLLYWEEILEKTEGLSGAYLSEVARRLVVHGFDNWKEELDSIIRTSPKPNRKSDDDDDDSDGPCEEGEGCPEPVETVG